MIPGHLKRVLSGRFNFGSKVFCESFFDLDDG